MRSDAGASVLDTLRAGFPALAIEPQTTKDEIPTAWVPAAAAEKILRHLKEEVPHPYRMLYDLTAVDERIRSDRDRLPAQDFTVVYHLLSFDRNEDVRIKVALDAGSLTLPSITPLWPAADWYEREVWDLFGIRFEGHPYLKRIFCHIRIAELPFLVGDVFISKLVNAIY